MILFYIMKFFFYNNLKDSVLLYNTFKNRCTIIDIQNDSCILTGNNVNGKTVSFKESNVSKIIEAIHDNSSNLNKDRIDRFCLSLIDTKKNNGVYTVLPYTNN